MKSAVHVLWALATWSCLAMPATGSPFLLVGSQTNAAVPEPVGLTIFGNTNGRLRALQHQSNATTGNQPTYMAVTQDRKFLYMTNEVPTGHIASFAIQDAGDGESLTLHPLGLAATESDGPVHLVPTKSGRFVLIASYNVGSITVMGVNAQGLADTIVDQIVFTGGSGVVPGRQDGPHAHCVALSPNDDYAFVTDLGNDRIMQYHFDAATGRLTPNDPPAVDVGPGALPRHMAFHPSGEHLFLTTEHSNELVKYRFDAATGTLGRMAAVTTTHLSGVLTGAIHITPAGDYVLVSNRYGAPASDDSVVVYSADLTHVGTYKTATWGGPRDFTITDDGFVFVANENRNSIDTFWLDATGRLVHAGLEQPSLYRPQVLLQF
ncbi:6-phosphogluconolactonase [Achlya hypogyna]|uniref:6-phosphogluconolactonase n=1 Tax=Achlya hypogyna TaxID=1202772 RepID=A0A1V9Z9B2_ACHHY|nr:6-phosphogluconolactonase [Achlya hypogyna]